MGDRDWCLHIALIPADEWSVFSVPGTVPATRNTEVSKTDMALPPWGSQPRLGDRQ